MCPQHCVHVYQGLNHYGNGNGNVAKQKVNEQNNSCARAL